MDDLATIRQRFAEDVQRKAQIRTDALVVALASVPRERFLGAGPWHIGIFEDGCKPRYRVSATAEPAEVYCDTVIAIDRARGLNNGEPSSLARWIDVLGLKHGETVVHIGSGTGYFTALLAHVVGHSGSVIAFEIDPGLAVRASKNLEDYPQVRVSCGSSCEIPARTIDAVFVNCGVTHPAMPWLTCLSDRGRILFPVTAAEPGDAVGTGGMYLATRAGEDFDLRYISGVGIFNCMGQRDEQLNLQLRSKEPADWRRPCTLHLDRHERVESCWLHGDTFCISTRLPTQNAA